MSDKIDLAEVEKYPLFILDEHVLALVRAVRAARAFDQCRVWPQKTELRIEMSAALAAFTDSAEAAQ